MDKRNLLSLLIIIGVIILVPKNILIAFLVFGLIVLVHEFGHYIVAKKSGIYVEEFAIGMGPKLIGVTVKETLYSIRALPLGGFCKMLGEDEEIEDARAFNRKPIANRIATILAGPIFNFILAFACALFFVSVMGYSTTRVDHVSPGTPAEGVFQEGDRILKIDGKRPITQQEMSIYIQLSKGEPLDITFERNGNTYTQRINPKLIIPVVLSEDLRVQEIASNMTNTFQFEDKLLQIDDLILTSEIELVDYIETNLHRSNAFDITILRGTQTETFTVPAENMVMTYQIGIASNRVEGNFFENVQAAFLETISWIKITVFSVIQLVTGNVSFNEIAGPVGMVNIISENYQQAAQLGFLTVMVNLAHMIILLSANLGVLNLLPIPALDGGRTIFLLIEAVRGKPLDREKEGFIHFIGFALLMLLMIVVLFNDIHNFFG